MNAKNFADMDPVPDGTSGNLNSVLTRNTVALRKKHEEDQGKARLQDRVAEAVTAFSGSMLFVFLHLVLVAAWVAVNLGVLPGVPVFDPSFVILATFASVEAIFLSTFVLISQNRAAAAAERRAELSLQTSLLAEYEITRSLGLVIAIAKHLGIDEAHDTSLEELQNYVAPEKVLDEIEDSVPAAT